MEGTHNTAHNTPGAMRTLCHCLIEGLIYIFTEEMYPGFVGCDTNIYCFIEYHAS